MPNLYAEMRTELLTKLKLMDTTIKGVSDSPQYHDAQQYNAAIRDALKVLDAHKEELSSYVISCFQIKRWTA